MNEVAFQELLLDARISESVSGLRKLILASALRGDFDNQTERQHQLSDAFNSIYALADNNKANKIRSRKSSSANNSTEEFLSVGNKFVVELGAIATIEKGKTGIKDAVPGGYPLVVTAEGRLTADHFDFEGPAVIIPLVSSTGHGDASLKRIHYQDGKYAVGSILCAVQSRFPEVVHPRYLYEYLSTFKEELLVARMSGTANVSLTVGKIAEVPVPLITYQAQEKLDRLMSLCDDLEATGQLDGTQHAQLLQTLLGTLTDSATPEELAANWQRVAAHFDLLLDRPEAVDALEQTILQLAVRGLLVPQDPNDEPASVLLQRVSESAAAHSKKELKSNANSYEATPPYELPAGWDWCRLGNMVENMGSGWSPACDEGERSDPTKWAVLRTTAVQVNEYRAREHKVLPSKLSPRPEIEVKDGDILITRAGPMNRVGISCWVNSTPPRLMLSDKIVRFHSVGDEMLPAFIVLTLNAGWTKTQIEAAKTGMAASQVNISQTDLRGLWLPVCSKTEQSHIVARVEELRQLCNDLRQRLTASRTTQGQLAEALVDTLND